MTSLSALLCLILIQSFPSAAHKKARIMRALAFSAVTIPYINLVLSGLP